MNGIGIDIIEITRFKNWHHYKSKILRRIFSQEELNYCLSNRVKSAERFAVRFAAKEAFYKALSQGFIEKMPPFLTFLSSVYIENDFQTRVPRLKFNESILKLPYIKISLTLSHAKDSAIACVFLSS